MSNCSTTKARIVSSAIQTILEAGGNIVNKAAQKFISQTIIEPKKKNFLEKTCEISTDSKTIVIENGKFIITDLAPNVQSDLDEYALFLGQKRQKRVIKIQEKLQYKQETAIFSNLFFTSLLPQNFLEEHLTRKSLENSLINQLGFIGRKKENASISEKKDMITMFHLTYKKSGIIARIDGSKLGILKVGEISINTLTNTYIVDQLLIKSNSIFYLVYANLDFDLLKISPQYELLVATKLLSSKNLNSEQYVGTITEDGKIFKYPCAILKNLPPVKGIVLPN